MTTSCLVVDVCIEVLIKDGVVSASCRSQGDPHITTFDRL